VNGFLGLYRAEPSELGGIGPGDKRLVAGTGQDDAMHCRVSTSIVENCPLI